jgi:hypothetical protein
VKRHLLCPTGYYEFNYLFINCCTLNVTIYHIASICHFNVVGVGLDVTVVLSAVVPELVMLVVFTITYMKVLEYALLFYDKK